MHFPPKGCTHNQNERKRKIGRKENCTKCTLSNTLLLIYVHSRGGLHLRIYVRPTTICCVSHNFWVYKTPKYTRPSTIHKIMLCGLMIVCDNTMWPANFTPFLAHMKHEKEFVLCISHDCKWNCMEYVRWNSLEKVSFFSFGSSFSCVDLNEPFLFCTLEKDCMKHWYRIQQKIRICKISFCMGVSTLECIKLREPKSKI